jgi:hypothetical protein
MKKQSKPSLPAGRKLNLSKKTIANLQVSEMTNKIGGGHGHSWNGCNSKNCTQNQNTCPGHATCYTC